MASNKKGKQASKVTVGKKISFLKRENTTSNLFSKVYKAYKKPVKGERLKTTLPSLNKLAVELNVSRKTIDKWFKQGYVPNEKKYADKIKKLSKEKKIDVFSYKSKQFTPETFNIQSFKKKKHSKEFLKGSKNILYEFRAGLEIEFNNTSKGSKKWVIQNLHFARFYVSYKEGLKKFENEMKEYLDTAFQSKIKKFRVNYFNVLKVNYSKK